MIMVTLLSLSCVNANDSNSTDVVLEVNDDVSQESNLELSDDNEDVLEITSDVNVLETTADEEILSSNESNGKTDSSAYLVLDNDANIENVYVGDYVVWICSRYYVCTVCIGCESVACLCCFFYGEFYW